VVTSEVPLAIPNLQDLPICACAMQVSTVPATMHIHPATSIQSGTGHACGVTAPAAHTSSPSTISACRRSSRATPLDPVLRSDRNTGHAIVSARYKALTAISVIVDSALFQLYSLISA